MKFDTMDIEIIQNVWLEPGTDYRKKQLEENILTPNEFFYLNLSKQKVAFVT